MGKVPPHLLAVPLPAQGHVLPLMELCLCLAKQGVRVTFVNTEFIHEKLMKTLMETDAVVAAGMGVDRFRLVSFPDGLTAAGRMDSGKLTGAVWGSMREKLEELIGTMRSSGDEVTCVVADRGMGSALEVAAGMGIRRAAFCPFSAMFISLSCSIPKMINDGIIDNDGETLLLTPFPQWFFFVDSL